MARKKVSPERLAEAHKEGAARLAAWAKAHPEKTKQRRALWKLGAKERNAKLAKAAEERRVAWVERARPACADLQFGDAIVYRGRVYVCLGPQRVETEKHGILACTAFRYWCVNCGSSEAWTVKGGSENLVINQPRCRGVRLAARCRDCAARVKRAGFNAALKDQPFGYAEEALAAMSEADCRFVCEAVATHVDIG